jgi:hypothetical protein
MAVLEHGDDGQVAHEQQHHGGKQTEAADQDQRFHPARRVAAPHGGQVVALDAGHDDREAVEPHAGQHGDGHEQGPEEAAPESFGPQHLRATTAISRNAAQ